MSLTLSGWFAADMFTWTIRLVHIAALGQTLFVILWATMPWYRHAVGRALMVKSFALMAYLDWAVLVLHFGPLPHHDTIALLLFGFITLGIWSQLLVIGGIRALELWGRHLERKRQG